MYTYTIPTGGGPQIVAIGGGTGLSTMLRGLKFYTKNITAIVTMADDGGGSGMLRQDLGMPPPGDVRNCLQALANCEPVMEQLFSYRFHDGSLKGQSMGNLILAALNEIYPSFDQAVSSMSQVLAITGRVLPVTNANIELVAEFENGTSVRGESKISAFKKEQDCRITRVALDPAWPEALPDALEAIRKADVILLGPGSLYTSIIPNLLVRGVSAAVAESRGLRVYVANIMTQEGETEGYTLSDHLNALLKHAGGRKLVDVCLANSAPIPSPVAARYEPENAAPLVIDPEAVEAMGVELVTAPLSDEKLTHKARHDPVKLAGALMTLIQDRCLRVSTADGIRYILDR
ncbi:MAG: YvcK family protein [Clostridiales bacterium]|nr:YvcK family protein [Clostridiales bacterium]